MALMVYEKPYTQITNTLSAQPTESTSNNNINGLKAIIYKRKTNRISMFEIEVAFFSLSSFGRIINDWNQKISICQIPKQIEFLMISITIQRKLNIFFFGSYDLFYRFTDFSLDSFLLIMYFRFIFLYFLRWKSFI